MDKDKLSDTILIVRRFCYACHMFGMYPSWENSYAKQVKALISDNFFPKGLEARIDAQIAKSKPSEP